MHFALMILGRDLWIMFAVTGAAAILLAAGFRFLFRRRKALLEP